MLDEAICVLEMSRPLAKMVPGVGGILDGSIEAVVKFAGAIKSAKVLKQDWMRLAEQAARITATVVVMFNDRSQDGSSGKSIFNAMRLLQTLERCHACAINAAKTNSVKAFLRIDKYKNEHTECSANLEEAIVIFGVQSHITSVNLLDTITAKLSTMQLDICKSYQMTSNSFDTMDRRLESIEHSFTNVEDHDGMYRLFRWSDFFIESTFNAPGDAVQQHRVKHRLTSECYVLRRYKREDMCGTQALDFVKENSHSNIEQLIGYSRRDAPGLPFYVTDAGETYSNLLKRGSTQDKMKLFVTMAKQYHDLETATSFLSQYSQGKSTRFAWTMGMFVMESEHTDALSIYTRLSSNGRLVFSFPPSSYNGSVYYKWMVAQAPDHRSSVLDMDSATRAWVKYLDLTRSSAWATPEMKHLYGSQVPSVLVVRRDFGHLSHDLTPKEAALLPPLVPCRPRKSRQHAIWNQVLHYRRLETGQMCYKLDSSNSSSEYHQIRSTWRSSGACKWLADNVCEVAAREGVMPDQIASVTGVTEDWVIKCFGLSTEIPTLYFITYPSREIGPYHIMPGYLATDPSGEEASRVIRWYYDDMCSRWNIEVEFHGLKWLIYRKAWIDYACLREDELKVLEEDNYWGDARKIPL